MPGKPIARRLLVLRMIVLLLLVVFFTTVVRGVLPEFFYVHGTPEAEYNQWQPLNQLTPLENALTLFGALALALLVIISHVKKIKRLDDD